MDWGAVLPPTPVMASTTLLLFLLVAASNSVGVVKVSPPSLHEGGNETESVSWFPATSFTDPCNVTQPPDNVVIGPPDDLVCGGVRKVTIWFLEKCHDLVFGEKFISIQAEPGERICVCVSNIEQAAGSGYHRLTKPQQLKLMITPLYSTLNFLLVSLPNRLVQKLMAMLVSLSKTNACLFVIN